MWVFVRYLPLRLFWFPPRTRASVILLRANDMVGWGLLLEPFVASAEPDFFCWTILNWQLSELAGLLA